MLSDKITTPNKAGTLKGVSPISSSRNVMVKVKDTASFIEAARAVHGDKYDYSLTDYSGSHKPITIICKKCGPVTLSEPGSHYRLEKKCGCRSCEQEATLKRKGSAKKCNQCGVRLKYGKKCQCKIDAKKKRIEELLARSCPVCGNAINSKDPRKVTCSVQCGIDRLRVSRVTVNCCVCKKPIKKYEKQVKENNCCSIECQREWALITNKGGRETDWLKRSSKAKKLWVKKRRKERLKVSTHGQWKRMAVSQLESLLRDEPDDWMRRCFSSSTGLEQRLFLSGAKKRRKPIKTFEELCIVTIVAKIDYSSMEEWSRKCYSTQKNMKWKRRLRNVKRHTLKHIEKEEVQVKQRSLWELLETQHPIN
jgi:hypothetical protein